MRRTWWRWARLLGGGAILAVLVARLGTGPFRAAASGLDGAVLVAAVVIGVVTTVACAWRWQLVSRGLGTDLPLTTAVAAYYRSLFLNSTLPGGVVGDVHRGVSHGREHGDVGLGLRSVVWERSAGQLVQGALTVAVLLLLPSPVRSTVPGVLAVAAAGVLALALSARLAPGPSRIARAVRAVARDAHSALGSRDVWPGVLLASSVVVAGHVAVFVIAARAAGTTASAARLLPISLLVLLAMSIPLNVAGGWGPREGVAAWAFGAAGLGAAQGVSAGVVYGVLALASVLPGAVVLAVSWWRDARTAGRPAPERVPEAVHG